MAAMEATLKIAARPFSKGTFLYSTPTYPEKMDLIGQGVLLEIDGNQIQDGCPSRHIGYRIVLYIERNLPLTTPIIPP